jgi:sec-independent protein translocase protein TatB
MFDFAWTEIALIGVVALIAIGPKDLPIAIKAVAGFIKKARRMAAEFQGHVDEMVREADLHEVRDQFNQLRNFNVRDELTKAVDADGSIRATMNETKSTFEAAAASMTQADTPPAAVTSTEMPSIASVAATPEIPSFIPPLTPVPGLAEPATPAPPAFIPPEAAHAVSSHTA